jgi:peptidyl-prolyl cis-trans isomerase A (cyclophilin A)
MNVRLLMGIVIVLSGCSRKAEPHFEQPKAMPAAEQPAPAAPEQPKAPEPAAEPAPSMLDMPKALVRSPNTPDPKGGKFTLAEAVEGLPKKGTLEATLETALGTITCKLFDDKAPNTVANFVGLARGLRPWWDARQAAWVTRPAYDNTSFHRAIAGFMIQGGDALGDGSGELGYVIDDELAPGLSHDRAGLLCMANRGPNTNSGQFFITDAAAPHLTQMKSYSIFGECKPLDVISKIARAPRGNAMAERPEPPVAIRKVTIERK